MRGPAIVGDHSRPRPGVAYAVMLALVVSILGGRAGWAQAPSTLRIIQSDPAPAAEDPSSEEIWISSDEPEPTTAVPTEFSRGEARPPLGSGGDPSVKRVLRVIGDPPPPEAPGLAVAASDQSAEKDLAPASRPEVNLRIPNLADSPEALRFRAAPSRASTFKLLTGGGRLQMSKAAESIDRVSSRDTFAQTQPAEAEQPVVSPTGALTIWNEAADDDLTMFYTTSGPRKPASLVFAPPLSSPTDGDTGAPKAKVQTSSRAPEAPTEQPTGQATIARAEQPSGRPIARTQPPTIVRTAPSGQVTIAPTRQPTIVSTEPRGQPTVARTQQRTIVHTKPSGQATVARTQHPSGQATIVRPRQPSGEATIARTQPPTIVGTAASGQVPIARTQPPTIVRTKPSGQATIARTQQPSPQPTMARRGAPTVQPPIASRDQPRVPPSLARMDAPQGPSRATPPSEEFSLMPQRRKTLRTKIDVVRVAVVDPSVCGVEQLGPRAISLVGKGQGSTQVTFWFRDGRHRPVTCLVRVASEQIRQVVFRVKIAELKGSALGEAGSDRDLKSSQHGSLLEALARAEAGARPVILDGLDTDQIESRLRRLEQQDRLRVVSRPTLMTSSGQPATVTTGDGAAETSIGSAGSGSPKAADLNAALTLLPVVTDNDDVQLHVVAEFSPSVSEPGVDPATDMTIRETATQVRLRPGQTLVVGSPLHELHEEKARGLVPIISQVIGYTEPEPEQAKLVVLITPELIPQSEKPASLASHQQLRPGKPALRR